MFKTRLDTFGNDFEHFWNIENFLIFLKFFEDSTLQLGKKKFSKKLLQNMFKTRLDTFGNDFEHFWNIENFLIFLKFFEDSTLHGTLGKKFFRKNYPKSCSKHVWTLLGTILSNFRILKIFWFFRKFRRIDPPWNTGQKNFSKKLPENMFKTRLDTFGNDFGHFWNFENFLIFFENFRRPSMEHWAKFFFGKITPKHVQNTFGHFWERFWAFFDF